MDKLEFITKLAWPLTVAFLAFSFRSHIRGMLANCRVSEFNAWGLTAKFEVRLDEVASLLTPTVTSQNLPQLLDQTKIEKQTSNATNTTCEGGQLDDSPRVLINHAWNGIEGALLDKVGYDPAPNGRRVRKNLNDAISLVDLGPGDRAAIISLHGLYGLLCYEMKSNVKSDQAVRFLDQANTLIMRINHAKVLPECAARHQIMADLAARK